MLSVLFTESELRFSQVVDFRGEPYVESFGVIPFSDIIKVDNASITLTWAESLKNLHKKLGYPEKKIIAVFPAQSFSYCFQMVDAALPENEKIRFLNWQGHEILDFNNDSDTLVHQKLSRVDSSELFISVAFPTSLKDNLSTACERSEFQITELIFDIQGMGQLLQYGQLFDHENTYCLNIDKHSNHYLIKFHQNELAGVIDLKLQNNGVLRPLLYRGNQIKAESEVKYFSDVIKGVADFKDSSDRRVIFNGRNPDEDSSHAYGYDFSGIFNFRHSIEGKNLNQFASTLGALVPGILVRFE
jgi:hypothetical protein